MLTYRPTADMKIEDSAKIVVSYIYKWWIHWFTHKHLKDLQPTKCQTNSHFNTFCKIGSPVTEIKNEKKTIIDYYFEQD